MSASVSFCRNYFTYYEWGVNPRLAPFMLVRWAGSAFVKLLLRLYFKWGAGPRFVRVHSRTNLPLAAQGGQVCQKILCAPVGRCDNFIDKGPACFAKIIRCCVLFGLDVFASSRWSLYSVTCIPRKPSPRNNVYPKGCGGDRKAPTRERAQVSQSKPKR